MQSPSARPVNDGAPPIVLLVEDDVDTLTMYSDYFEASGMWVATASAPPTISGGAIGGCGLYCYERGADKWIRLAGARPRP